MIDTITSDSGVKYDVVDVIHRDHPFFRWQYVLQKFSQSIWECNHSFDSSLLSNPPIAVCSKCGFQKRERTVSEKQDFWKKSNKYSIPIRSLKDWIWWYVYEWYFFYGRDWSEALAIEI